MELSAKLAFVAVVICILVLNFAYYSRVSLPSTHLAKCPEDRSLDDEEPPFVPQSQPPSVPQSQPPSVPQSQPPPVPQNHEKPRPVNTTDTPYDTRIKYYKSQIFAASDEKSEKCTMIMITYKRLKSLPKILNSYCNMTKLDKILVIWNDIGNPIPQSILDISKHCTVELLFIIPKENKISNRFWPRTQTETECVIINDDDLIVAAEDIEFGIGTWQKFKHLLIGFYERTRGYFLLKDGTYKYSIGGAAKQNISPQHKTGYSIVLPPLFFHRAYLEMLFDPMIIPSELITYIDKIMNCDDILMSITVTKFMQDCGWPQSGGLQLQLTHKIESTERWDQGPGGHRGLATRQNHYTVRTDCLNKFAKSFGRLPLVPQELTVINKLKGAVY